MESVYCPKCQSLNPSEQSFCNECGHPLDSKVKQKAKLWLPIAVFILLIAMAGTALIYIDVRHPDYGLAHRLGLSWEILSQKDWLKKYRDYQSLLEKIKKKEKKLKALNKKIHTKEQVIRKLETLQKKIKDLEKKLSQ
ncbi:MAG: hypothetical protein IEMM0008_0978 [bacterium]|nr:MAG: hypothetical protein IEMM0008_0978 [bacterium]